MLLSVDETLAYLMAWGRHFGQNMPEDLPFGICMELKLLTLGDLQQANHVIINEDDNPDKSHL